jgi:hypothetical protein
MVSPSPHLAQILADLIVNFFQLANWLRQGILTEREGSVQLAPIH